MPAQVGDGVTGGHARSDRGCAMATIYWVAWRHADDRLGGRRGRDHRPDRAAGASERWLRLSTVDELVDAMRPAGGARRAGARGGRRASGSRWPPGSPRPRPRRRARRRCARLARARPTAVNLARGVDSRPPPAGRAAPRRCSTRRCALRDAEIAAQRGDGPARRRSGDRAVRCRAAAADPLQHRRAGHGGRRYRARRGGRAAPPRPARRGDRERDPAAAAGRPVDRVGAGYASASRTGSRSTAPGRS